MPPTFTSTPLDDTNRRVTYRGNRYRVAVYRAVNGWSSFVEGRFYEGGTRLSPSPAVAYLRALRLIRRLNDDRHAPDCKCSGCYIPRV